MEDGERGEICKGNMATGEKILGCQRKDFKHRGLNLCHCPDDRRFQGLCLLLQEPLPDFWGGIGAPIVYSDVREEIWS